jgi:hypothetical protein
VDVRVFGVAWGGSTRRGVARSRRRSRSRNRSRNRNKSRSREGGGNNRRSARKDRRRRRRRRSHRHHALLPTHLLSAPTIRAVRVRNGVGRGRLVSAFCERGSRRYE